MKGRCPYCEKEKELITKLGRRLCKNCWKKLDENKSDPEIGIKEFLIFFDSRCSYHPDIDKSFIRFGGISYGAEWATFMLIHEYHHHVIKILEGLEICAMWDKISPRGLLERLVYDPDNA